MFETISLVLALAAPQDGAGGAQATGSAAIRIVRAEEIRAATFDPADPRARIVEREENGQPVRLHLIEYE